MQTLSYGYKLPESGDKGSSLWQALEDNITRLNGHTHNGTDSPKLQVQNFAVTKQTITSAGWSANGPTGYYRQSVSIPAGFTWDDFRIQFRNSSTGEVIDLTSAKIDNTSYYIYSFDNTLGVTAIYGV